MRGRLPSDSTPPGPQSLALGGRQKEQHFINRVGWLRAAVLGANDGIISTASLMVGVAAAVDAPSQVLIAGLSGMIAGSMSMAAGEYVSVSSQADTERADLAKERRELADDPPSEAAELAQIYIDRGVEPALAEQVAHQLMRKDALGAHARDELGISDATTANPIQAALTSASTFAAGAALPIAASLLAPQHMIGAVVAGAALVSLGALGAIGARIGGAKMFRPALRVAFWGALAMAVTAAMGTLIGRVV